MFKNRVCAYLWILKYKYKYVKVLKLAVFAASFKTIFPFSRYFGAQCDILNTANSIIKTEIKGILCLLTLTTTGPPNF